MIMTPAAIAANRFGLGMRGDGAAIGDPKAYLLDQLQMFDPRPTALKDVPTRADVADTLVSSTFKRKRRSARRRLPLPPRLHCHLHSTRRRHKHPLRLKRSQPAP